MIRNNTYEVDHILSLIGSADKVSLDGDRVGIRSLRLLNFKVHGITCVTCGLKGKFFATEKSHKRDGSYHLNLYGIRDDGTEVLMTQDHIVPLSLNGENVLTNLQPMCYPCNNRKGNGRNNTFKTLNMSNLLRTTYTPLKKNVGRLAAAIENGTVTMEHLNLLILALNHTTCRSINPVALKSVPTDIGTIDEIDNYSTKFIPIGERVVIACRDNSENFYIYDKYSGDRLSISMK